MKLLIASMLCSAAALAESSAEGSARAFIGEYRRPVEPPAGLGSPEKTELGRMLFFDPRLSASGIVSCATCHNPALSWGDGLPRAVGHGMKNLGRRSPTILNLAWGGPFMWDGRFETLEQQALGPITSPDEMNMPVGDLLKKLTAVERYRTGFAKVFPRDGLTADTIAQAIAAYERTVVSAAAPFDRWLTGAGDAISEGAKRGFVLFNTRAACSKCHSGWRFTDDSFHDIGVKGDDLGRGGLKDFEGFAALQHAFKTPTLRDADRRGPFLPDGSAATLEQVIELYDVGGQARRGSLSDDLKPLKLTAREKHDLVDFLKTLASPGETSLPVLPR